MQGTYSAPELLTIIGAVGVLLTAAGAVIVNIIVALKTGSKVEAIRTETTALRAEVKEVHTLTNSGLSAVKAELKESNAMNAELRVVIRDLKAEREKLSISVAMASQPNPQIPQVLGTVVEESLDAIKDSTEAIDKNTRKELKK